jgi:hypothetical protein
VSSSSSVRESSAFSFDGRLTVTVATPSRDSSVRFS